MKGLNNLNSSISINSGRNSGHLQKFLRNAESLIESGYYLKETAPDSLVLNHKGNKSRSFVSAIKEKRFILISELKQSSPSHSKKYFPDNMIIDRSTTLVKYSDAISILTEPNFFSGELNRLSKFQNSSKPVLMKDFIISKEQILAGISADAFLLIKRILSPDSLLELVNFINKLDKECIIEVDSESDFVNLLNLKFNGVLAINNRNLATLKIDQNLASRIFKEYEPKRPVLSFSGVSDPTDVENIVGSGLSGVLIGTALSKSRNPGKLLERFNTIIKSSLTKNQEKSSLTIKERGAIN